MRRRSSVIAAVAALGCALLSACTDDENPAASPAPASPAPAASGSPSSAGPAAAPNLAAPREVATGIRVPWGLAFLPGGDALVSERNSGRILQIAAAGGAPREVYRVPGVAAQGEGGLLGIAVSPTFAQDRYVFAYFTASNDNRIVPLRFGD